MRRLLRSLLEARWRRRYCRVRCHVGRHLGVSRWDRSASWLKREQRIFQCRKWAPV